MFQDTEKKFRGNKSFASSRAATPDLKMSKKKLLRPNTLIEDSLHASSKNYILN